MSNRTGGSSRFRRGAASTVEAWLAAIPLSERSGTLFRRSRVLIRRRDEQGADYFEVAELLATAERLYMTVAPDSVQIIQVMQSGGSIGWVPKSGPFPLGHDGRVAAPIVGRDPGSVDATAAWAWHSAQATTDGLDEVSVDCRARTRRAGPGGMASRGAVCQLPHRSNAAIIAGLAFLRNLHRDLYELATESPGPLRVAVVFDELAQTI